MSSCRATNAITVRHAGVEWSRDRVREVVAEMLVVSGDEP